MEKEKECNIVNCPQNNNFVCELSQLGKNHKFYTNPDKCAHYKWKNLKKGEK